MNRKKIFEAIINTIPPDCAIVVIGNNLNYNNKRKDILFLGDEPFNLSFCLGIILTIKKKVFILCEDEYAIKNLSEFMQMAVSNCNNLYIFLLVSGKYNSVNSPTIFNSINSKYSLFHGLGFFTLDYTKYFNSNNLKAIELGVTKNRGPAIMLVDVELDRNNSNRKVSGPDELNNFLEFLAVEENK